MDDEVHTVIVSQWPRERLTIGIDQRDLPPIHHKISFDDTPVTHRFLKDPVNLAVTQFPPQPIGLSFEQKEPFTVRCLPCEVDMDMTVSTSQKFTLPSEYVINVVIFDNPVASITVKGRTDIIPQSL